MASYAPSQSLAAWASTMAFVWRTWSVVSETTASMGRPVAPAMNSEKSGT
jgi:hypothetical protein